MINRFVFCGTNSLKEILNFKHIYKLLLHLKIKNIIIWDFLRENMNELQTNEYKLFVITIPFFQTE